MNSNSTKAEVVFPVTRVLFRRVVGLLAGLVSLFGTWPAVLAETAPVAASTGLPDVGASLFRIMGAVAVVIAVFLGGVWLVRNWQRFAAPKGRAPRLNVLEARSLGPRHTIYVVGYEQQRLLVAASPAGITLLSHLPASEVDDVIIPAPVSFGSVLEQVFQRKA